MYYSGKEKNTPHVRDLLRGVYTYWKGTCELTSVSYFCKPVVGVMTLKSLKLTPKQELQYVVDRLT